MDQDKLTQLLWPLVPMTMVVVDRVVTAITVAAGQQQVTMHNYYNKNIVTKDDYQRCQNHNDSLKVYNMPMVSRTDTEPPDPGEATNCLA